MELDDLRALERGGRSRPPKVDIIEATIKNEVQEYETGFELPDLTIKRVYELFGNWNGDLNGITALQKRRFKKQKQTQQAGEAEEVQEESEEEQEEVEEWEQKEVDPQGPTKV